MMTHEWFSPEAAVWFSSAGLLCLTGLATPVIAKGRHKGLILGLWSAVIAAGAIFLAAGLLAWRAEQPDHVVWPLVATGLVMAAGYGISLLFVLRAYALADHRKIAAHEL